MQDMAVDPNRVIAALRRRVDELTYEVVVLSAAFDQQQERLNQAEGRSAG
ncbi:hypothetical protein [Streptosporangium sp. OZ121]